MQVNLPKPLPNKTGYEIWQLSVGHCGKTSDDKHSHGFRVLKVLFPK